MKKKQQLCEIREEHKFFSNFFSDVLGKDEQILREEMGEIKLKEKPTDDDIQRGIELEREIGKLTQVKMRLKNSEQVEKELVAFIYSIWR